MSETEAALREQLEEHSRRITELEIEAAFRRRAHEELDEVVREQSEQIAGLEQRIRELLGQLELSSETGP